MVKNSLSIFVIVSIMVLVVFASGCTNSQSITFKHYDDNNFSFDYPSDWEIIKNYTIFKVGWSKSGSIYGGIAVVPLDSGETFNDYIKSENSRTGNINQGKNITVGNYSGVSYSFIDNQGAYYIAYLDGGNVVYQIEVKDYNTHMDSELNKSAGYTAFNKILNTLVIKINQNKVQSGGNSTTNNGMSQKEIDEAQHNAIPPQNGGNNGNATTG